MEPEAALWQALRAQHTDITRLDAWLDLFLKLAQPRIESLRSMLHDWAQRPEATLPFSALTLADELAGLCAEKQVTSLYQLSAALADALRRASAGQVHASDRAALEGAVEELWRQLHQHAAGVPVLTPPHILAAVAGD
jgi:hypothetical protein